MLRTPFTLLCLLVHFAWLHAQPPTTLTNAESANEIIALLASDSLQGRGNYTPELQKAADYIEQQFVDAGLEPLPGYDHFAIPINFKYHPASLYQLSWNGQLTNPNEYLFISAAFFQPVFRPGNYLYTEMTAGPDSTGWVKIFNADQPQIINFNIQNDSLLKQINIPSFVPTNSILIVKNKPALQSMKLDLVPESEKVLMNIVGVIPGKSLANEAIIFSAHYDHLPPAGAKKDFFNGANDNASGTAALILLARHYTMQNNNERTLVFCAFAGEEIGLLGSQDLVKKMNTKNIIAMINMDMVGISKFNNRGFILTGTYRSRLSGVFKKNLDGHDFNMYPDVDTQRNLYERSDNYPFALAGVPAHTIMTADDESKCYHQACDEHKNIDMENIVMTVNAIITAASTLIDGTDNPRQRKKKK